MSVCQFKLGAAAFFFTTLISRDFFIKNCFCYCFDQGQFFVLFLRKKFSKQPNQKTRQSTIFKLEKNIFHDFFFWKKKNNLTVLDDLAAMTRMTGGLNVGGNQTFPGPFYVR